MDFIEQFWSVLKIKVSKQKTLTLLQGQGEFYAVVSETEEEGIVDTMVFFDYTSALHYFNKRRPFLYENNIIKS